MIRKFQPRDEDAVIRIWLEASAIAHYFIPRSYWENNTASMREIYIPQSDTFVHTDDTTGEITGFISLSGNYLAALFVAPARQGKGTGQALMTYAKTLKPELELNVYRENTRAVTFYKHQGFKITREQTDEATGQKEYVMVYQIQDR